MSQCEIIPFIQLGLNNIMDKKDIDNLIDLYKMSILIKYSDDDNYKKLFAINYLNFYYTRFEFISGIKVMDDKSIGDIKVIMINSLDYYFKKIKRNQEDFIRKYYERRDAFLNLPADVIRQAIIDEQLRGINSSISNIKSMTEIVNSISYEEQKRLDEINIDFELSKVLGKIKNKYTEDGNYEDDREVVSIIENNLNKRGYTSHHLHLYVYDELERAISKIFDTYNKVYQKVS